jgi:hypothetical protein
MPGRSTRVLRKDIKHSVVLRVWARAAGRCVLCSTYLIGDGSNYLHSAMSGEVAHNAGASGGQRSPRGNSALPHSERAQEENLLLLCHDCHRSVDADGAELVFTELYLRDKKARHEERVRSSTNFATVLPAAVFRLSARIRGTQAGATQRQISQAMHLDDLTRAGELPRDSMFSVSLSSDETDEWAWSQGASEISKEVARLNRSGFADTVGVFAIAPIPLLVHLGAELDDKSDVRMFPRFRDAEDLAWSWRRGVKPVSVFELSDPVRDPRAREITVDVSVTASVHLDRAPREVVNLPRVSLSAATPGTDVIETKADLEAFARAWRSTLAKIETAYPNCETIHVLAAVPIVAAVSLGRHHMRDAQPSLEVYQLGDNGYSKALRIPYQ